MTLNKLESRLTLKVKKVRLSDDDLKAIVKRVNSSRSIQWWKDDIKQLLYEVKCLKDENEAVAALTAENARMLQYLADSVKSTQHYQEQNAALREALKPLAKLWHEVLADKSDDTPVYGINDVIVTVGQIKAARRALGEGK